jgi:hypothetical protein
MTPERRSPRSARRYPALRLFARAYLHEDFIAEYGGPIEAAEAFCADATADERRALANELDHLATASAKWSQSKLAGYFADTIGGAWANPSATTLREMATAVGR